MKRKRSWVFLLTGVVCAVISVLLYWLRWRTREGLLGTRYPAIWYGVGATYLISLLSMVIWLFRSSDRALKYAAFGLVAAGLLALALWWLNSEYPVEFFAISRKLILGRSLEEYDLRYVINWSAFFLGPLLEMLNLGVDLLVLVSLVLWIVRRVVRSVRARREGDTGPPAGGR